MGEPESTRVSLLVRIRDPGDGAAWRQFVAIYAPLIFGFARRRGLQDADAADLTQEVLRSVASAAGRFDYDAGRGSFRSWLFTVSRNALNTFLEARRRRDVARGGSSAQIALQDRPAREEDETARWEQDYRQRRFSWAAEQVRGGFEESSWEAFWQTAVEGRSPKAVAEALGMSVGAVYIAKSRALARIREQIRLLPPDD
jgi:RNA polymerase sigma-70 factor (ECF subfamily)